MLRNHISLFFSLMVLVAAGCGGPKPSITAIAPTSGPTVGGTAVTITGANFTGLQAVTIGGQALVGLSVVDGTTVTGTTPPGAAGPQDVVVANRSGSAILAGGFTYVEDSPPAVTSISPNGGPDVGGTQVTITGTHFTGVQSVRIGGQDVTGISVTSDTSLTAMTPSGTPGAQDVVVVTAGGTGTLAGGFTYTRISPVELGTLLFDNAEGVAVDSSGNIFVTGYTQGSFPSFTNAGGADVFVIKFHPNGQPQWIQQIGTAGDDFAYGVATDAGGDVFIAGYTRGSLLGFTNAGGADAFVMGFDPGGQLLWTHQVGTIDDDYGLGVTTDGGGNVFVAGSAGRALPGATSSGGLDGFVMKLNSSGVRQWIQQVGTTGSDVAVGVVTDSGGNIFITGNTSGSFPGFANAGFYDAYVMELNAGGARQWVQQLGTADTEYVSGVALDGSGNIIIAGYTNGNFPGSTSAGLNDGFVAKFDAGGTRQWVQELGTADNDYAAGVAADRAGNVFVTGSTAGSFPGYTNVGNSDDFFVMKLNAGGQPQWTRQGGTNSLDDALGVAVDGSGDIFVTGYSGGNFPPYVVYGAYDVFWVKYDTNGTVL